MTLKYEIIHRKELNKSNRKIFSQMLKEQGKVQGALDKKADRCTLLCNVKVDDSPIAIGAIKEKSSSDFHSRKADLQSLSGNFEWELGYLYTKKDYEGQGIASIIVKKLIENYGDNNLMASTEISANPGMVRILEKNGFRLYGKPWKSNIHDNFLGLFLKFK